ncbi:LuxR C-terminal-related transcriptional regulator [Kitasatospora sp. NPDC058170]|uniref:LuxR C-terminal-related transcriptional regulator n=1 Tax=Kitasatospora sp. NPDC058170 TaxID=3346364 RepID=UPI0036DBCB78
MLECLGLSSHAESVYRTMLLHPRWGVQELAVHLEHDEQRVRRSLDELADLALVRPSRMNSESVFAVSPRVGLSALLSERESQLLEQQRAVTQGRSAAARLIDEFSEHRSAMNSVSIERLTDLVEVRERIEELSHNIQREVLSIIPFTPLDPAGLEASRDLDRDLLERGIKMQTVYLDSIRNDPTTRRYAAWLTSIGGAVRTAPTLPLHMIVIDKAFGVLPIDPENSAAGALVVQEKSILTGLTGLFESLWEAATPFGVPEERDDRSLTPQEQALLNLLATGITDEAASKRLGLSLRSVRRLMSDLMSRLGASSRFEAGLRAAEKGWL